MRRIAVINQKGGVGKTTTTVNVGAALARRGHRVLLIDLDPQSHLSLHLGQDPTAGRPGTYELLTGKTSLAKARVKVINNLWVVGASIDLAAAEVDLVSVVGREVILRDLLEQHVGAGQDPRTAKYDYVLIDCPPSLGVLTLNGLCAAREVVIPLQPHYLALQGMGKLLETVLLVNKRINPELSVSGVALCMYDAGTKLAAEVVDDLRGFLSSARDSKAPWAEARVYETVIRRNIKLAEAPSYGKSIFEYAGDSNGAKDYEALSLEIEGRPVVHEDKQSNQPATETPPISEDTTKRAPAEPAAQTHSAPPTSAAPDPGVAPDPVLPAALVEPAQSDTLREAAEQSKNRPSERSVKSKAKAGLGTNPYAARRNGTRVKQQETASPDQPMKTSDDQVNVPKNTFIQAQA